MKVEAPGVLLDVLRQPVLAVRLQVLVLDPLLVELDSPVPPYHSTSGRRVESQ